MHLVPAMFEYYGYMHFTSLPKRAATVSLGMNALRGREHFPGSLTGFSSASYRMGSRGHLEWSIRVFYVENQVKDAITLHAPLGPTPIIYATLFFSQLRYHTFTTFTFAPCSYPWLDIECRACQGRQKWCLGRNFGPDALYPWEIRQWCKR